MSGCLFCGKKGVKLLRCSRCKEVYYCSPECQRNDWEKHKEVCTPPFVQESLETIPCPIVPLSFERYNSLLEDAVNEKMDIDEGDPEEFAASYDISELNAQVEARFCTDEVVEAAKIALKAYNIGVNDPVSACEQARKALEVSEVCPEAHCVLALLGSSTYEEALEHYKKGEELGSGLCDDFDEICSSEQVWAHVPLRSYFRCVHGVANTLRKMGRLEESLESYRKLLRLDSNFYPACSSYVNYRYHIPEVLLKLERLSECAALMDDPDNEPMYKYISSGCAWWWSKALLDYSIWRRDHGSSPEFCSDYFTSTGAQRPGANAIIEAIVRFHGFTKVLNGDAEDVEYDVRSNNEKLSRVVPGILSRQAVWMYASSHLMLWRSTPGAVEYALRTSSTVVLLSMIRKENILPLMGYPRVPQLSKFRKILHGKGENMPFLNAKFETGRGFVHQVIVYGTPKQLEELGKCGVSFNCIDEDWLSPLHLACYYDKDVRLIEALLNSGLDPLLEAPNAFSPLMMAVNQGNADVFKFVMNAVGEKVTGDQRILQRLLIALMNSSVFQCVNGGSKCERCITEKGFPHSEGVDFKKCVDIILESGLEVTDTILRYAHVSHNGDTPLEEYFRLQTKDLITS